MAINKPLKPHRKLISDASFKASAGLVGLLNPQPKTYEDVKASPERQLFEEDRAHTEARQDSAIQRAVLDAQKAGLNPAGIFGSSSVSSGSSEAASFTPQDEESLTNILRAFVPFAMLLIRRGF